MDKLQSNFENIPAELKEPLSVILSEIQRLRTDLKASARSMLPVEEAASYLGISPKTIRNGLSRKAVKPFPVRPVRVDGRVLFRRSDLDSYIASLVKKGGAN
jgi:predicted DNA-binding transcriptional regulator AlpA